MHVSPGLCPWRNEGLWVVWTDLAALLYNVTYCEAAEDDTAVSWPVVGRFKSRHGILDCYMIFTWTQRFIRRLAREGYEDGWDKGKGLGLSR